MHQARSSTPGGLIQIALVYRFVHRFVHRFLHRLDLLC